MKINHDKELNLLPIRIIWTFMMSAIVLAAGSSRRMGSENKLLLSFNHKTIIESTIEHIMNAGVEELIVVLGFQHRAIELAIKRLHVKTIYNKNFEDGLTTSIQKGISIATGHGYMLCLSDMALVSPNEYKLIKLSFEDQYKIDNKTIAVPVYNDQKGNPVVFSSWYKNAIMGHDDMNGCKKIVQQYPEHIFQVNMSANHVLADIDTKEDYIKLQNENNNHF